MCESDLPRIGEKMVRVTSAYTQIAQGPEQAAALSRPEPPHRPDREEAQYLNLNPGRNLIYIASNQAVLCLPAHACSCSIESLLLSGQFSIVTEKTSE